MNQTAFYDDYSNVRALMKKIIFIIGAETRHRGHVGLQCGSMSFSNDTSMVCATPLWEDALNFCAEVSQNINGKEEFLSVCAPFTWTGDIDKDARAWADLLIPVLNQYL